MRHNRFTFLCNAEERGLLAILAEKLERTQSDTVRFVIREKARELLEEWPASRSLPEEEEIEP